MYKYDEASGSVTKQNKTKKTGKTVNTSRTAHSYPPRIKYACLNTCLKKHNGSIPPPAAAALPFVSAVANHPLSMARPLNSQVMERQLVDEDSTFWADHFPGLVRERQAGAFTHVLSVVFVRGAFLFGIAEAATHGRSIIENNNEDSPVCRAFYKIKEVSSRVAIGYDRRWTAVRGTVAIVYCPGKLVYLCSLRAV